MGRPAGGQIVRDIYYRPLPSQRAFHANGERFKGFSGPIGSGKSAALCQEAIRLCYLNQGRTGLIGAPTYPMLRDSTQAALFDALQTSKIPYEFNKAENQATLTDLGSRIIFRSLDDYERLRGTNLAWFGVDELTYTYEEAWLRLEGRLRDPKAKRLCGFAVWTPKGFDWVFRRFIQSPPPGYAVVQARPYENSYLLDKVPDFYERLKGSYDAGFFAQEVLGSYLNPRQGLVYKAFSRADHVRTHERDESIPLRWALDFNVDPMSSVVAQLRDGVLEVLDEIVLSRATTEEACAEFARRYPEWPQGLVIYADSSAHQQQTTGLSDADMISGFFAQHARQTVHVRIPRCNPGVRERVNLTNARLKSASGDIGLTVDERCRELIKDFEEVEWVEGTYELNKTKDLKRTHLSDALGYLVWAEFGVKKTAGLRNRRLPCA